MAKILKSAAKLTRGHAGRAKTKMVTKVSLKAAGAIRKAGRVVRHDPALDAVLESATDLYAEGLISDARMREYARLCVTPPAYYSGKDIRGLRKRYGWSQPLLAAKLAQSSSTVEKWENDVNTPNGAARRLLEMLDRKGPQALELE